MESALSPGSSRLGRRGDCGRNSVDADMRAFRYIFFFMRGSGQTSLGSPCHIVDF